MEKEDKIIEILTDVSTQLQSLIFPKSTFRQIIIIVASSLIVALITAGIVSWETSKVNTVNTKRDIREMKQTDNYNFQQIAKTLKIPLMLHDMHKNPE